MGPISNNWDHNNDLSKNRRTRYFLCPVPLVASIWYNIDIFPDYYLLWNILGIYIMRAMFSCLALVIINTDDTDLFGIKHLYKRINVFIIFEHSITNNTCFQGRWTEPVNFTTLFGTWHFTNAIFGSIERLTLLSIRVHQNIKKFSEFNSYLIYVVSIWKKTKNERKKDFWGVFLAWPPFCRKCPFYTHAFKSGKWIKQTPTSPFWGNVGVKKWSQILDSGTRSPIFGHLKMGTFGKSKKGIFYKMVARRGKCPKNHFFLHFWSPFI